jgi:hypothetical protein
MLTLAKTNVKICTKDRVLFFVKISHSTKPKHVVIAEGTIVPVEMYQGLSLKLKGLK